MNTVLVVGSGVAGLQASVDLAELGYEVLLVEKEDELGGHLRNLGQISPGQHSAPELLSSYIGRIKDKDNITVLKNAEILEFKGNFPKFQALVKANGKKTNFNVNAVILATGLQAYDPSVLELYGYGKLKDVITSLELGRMMKDGKLVKPSNMKCPESVAIIQCVGSRYFHNNEYCSDFCCNNSIKLAQLIRTKHPNVAVSIFHIDMRTPFKGELEYREARSIGVRFPRGKPARIREDNGVLTIQVEDTLENDLIYCPFDLVVLSVGGVPDSTVKSLKSILNVDLLDSGFFALDERTLSTKVKGIFVAGAAGGPKDIAYSTVQGSCAAAKVHICLRAVKHAIEIAEKN